MQNYKIKFSYKDEYLKTLIILHENSCYWASKSIIDKSFDENFSLIVSENIVYQGFGYGELSSYTQSNNKEISGNDFIKEYNNSLFSISDEQLEKRLLNINNFIILYVQKYGTSNNITLSEFNFHKFTSDENIKKDLLNVLIDDLKNIISNDELKYPNDMVKSIIEYIYNNTEDDLFKRIVRENRNFLINNDINDIVKNHQEKILLDYAACKLINELNKNSSAIAFKDSIESKLKENQNFILKTIDRLFKKENKQTIIIEEDLNINYIN